MLDPHQRSTLTSLLNPPLGTVFHSGVAMTYSLDLVTLLGATLPLAGLLNPDRRDVFTDPICLLEALHQVTGQLTVFADRGETGVPPDGNALFGLLERTVVEVRAPGAGAFHPKLWVLRFVHAGDGQTSVIRVGILSRNLTADPSWDLSLVLEGRPQGRYIAQQRVLGEFLNELCDLGQVGDDRRTQIARIADELRRTPFASDIAPWSELKFHVLGMKRGRLPIVGGHEIAVIAPFLTPGGLAHLVGGKQGLVLISRPEELAKLSLDERRRFERCMVLQDAAETENGEEAPDRAAIGLHAKAFIVRNAWDTHLYVGSANATTPALVSARNVEVVAELVGRHSKVGRPEALLSSTGLGEVLVDFDPATPAEDPLDSGVVADALFDQVQRRLSDAQLTVRCASQEDGTWSLTLQSAQQIDLQGAQIRAWTISQRAERGVDAQAIAMSGSVVLASVDAADVTGFTAFALTTGPYARRFALNLQVLGLPDDRDAAILRRMVRNSDGFLRYLQLLLSGLGGNFELQQLGGSGTAQSWVGGGVGAPALLEDLVLAWSREPARLKDVQRVVDRLRGHAGENGAVIPDEFEVLWRVFEQAIAEDA